MKKIILVYGGIAGIVLAASFFVPLLFTSGTEMSGSVWLGYLIMIIALSTVFFGVKSYRDQVGGGVIRFSTGLKIGIGISLVASVLYVAGWEVYFNLLDPGYADRYAAASLEQMKIDGDSQTEIDAAAAQMKEFQELYKNLFARMGFTLLEILPVGLLVSLISAALLRKSDVLPQTPA